VSKIKFAEARQIALEMAQECIAEIAGKYADQLLNDEFYIAEEYCWMFFRNPKIVISYSSFKYEWSFVVSKWGEQIWGFEFPGEPERACEHAKNVSGKLKSDFDVRQVELETRD
jgi:hypothetical protein